MTAAVFGLVGVLVGALIAGGFDLYFERRREQADLRQATRLVGDEIHTQWLHHELLLEAGRYPKQDAELMMPTAAWEANKATLARHLRDEWGFVATVEHAMKKTRDHLLGQPTEAPITEEWRSLLENGRALTREAYEMLTGKEP